MLSSHFHVLLFPGLLLLVLPPISTSLSFAHENSESQDLQSMNMDMLPSEKEIVFQIMDSMSSDRRWRLTNPYPCSPGSAWPGIECKQGSDDYLHVSRLDFGTTPNPSCKKTAVFPSQIFSLPCLQSIFFFKCFTHTKTTLSIPLHIKPNFTLITQLSLRSNPALIGPLPPQISTIRSLQVLTLSQNRLHGKIPEAISALTSLLHLDLSYNFLTGSIPPQLGSLSSLVDLDLSYNSLTGSIPPRISDMGFLRKLDLSSNSLTGVIPSSLVKLRLLVFIDLSGNRLTGTLPAGVGKLQNLQYLIMDGNPMFTRLPTEIGNLGRLQELRLANAGFSGSIPQGFSQLLNLTTLSLQNNRLTGGIPAGLSRLPHIYHLNLSRNLLDGTVPFDAGFFKRLGSNLDLSGNPGLCLTSSQGFVGMKIGIDFCGMNRTQPISHQLKRSEASFVGHNFCNLLGFLGVWLLYLTSL